MRRLWFMLGLGLGALIVWSLGYSDRKMAAVYREEVEGVKKLLQRDRMERAMQEAVGEKPRTISQETLDELARYDDPKYWEMWENWEEDDYDG